MSDIYYHPEKYDLTIVGELDETDLSYEFNMLVVWERKADGALFYGEDSGCSCPSPFESFGVSDLEPINRETLEQFRRRVQEFPDTPDARDRLVRAVEDRRSTERKETE